VTALVRALACALLICLAGCPAPPDGNGGLGNGNSALAGTWRGTLTCTRTESLGSTTADPTTSTVTFEITFDDNGNASELTVLGFAGAPDQPVMFTAVGQTADQSSANGALVISQTATLTAIGLTDTRAEFGLSIDYSAIGGALTQDGRGTQTIAAELSGDALTYTATATYEVQQTTGPIELDTGETIACTGTLSRV